MFVRFPKTYQKTVPKLGNFDSKAGCQDLVGETESGVERRRLDQIKMNEDHQSVHPRSSQLCITSCRCQSKSVVPVQHQMLIMKTIRATTRSSFLKKMETVQTSHMKSVAPTEDQIASFTGSKTRRTLT